MLENTENTSFKSMPPELAHSKVTQIHDIKSIKARNLLRGVDQSNYRLIKKALEKIKIKSNYTDYKKSLLYIRTNKLFTDSDIGQLFINSCPKILPETVEFSLQDIVTQIRHNYVELCELTEIAIEINTRLKKCDLMNALNSCDKLIEKKGVSIFLIKTLSFITNRYQLLEIDDSEILGKIDSIKLKINLSNCPFIEEVVTQLSNLRTSHIGICKRINGYQSTSPESFISKSFINPTPRNSKEFNITLSSFFAFSLFDAFLYIQTINKINLPYIDKIDFEKNISIIYSRLSHIEFEPIEMYKSIDDSSGYCYLRECFLFTEQQRALKFLIIHGHYYSDRIKNIPQPLYTKNLIDFYFKNITNLSQLKCTKMDNVKFNWVTYEPTTCGILENSSALLYLLEKKQGIIEAHEQETFVNLMTFTRDIGEVCPPEYLETIALSANTHLLRLVAQCLITINKKNQFAEHQLRTTIQEYCIKEFNGNLISLLDNLYIISPAVTEHLLLICNETFLSTLFHLLDKPVDAMQVRADMLHWFGEKTGSKIYLDRAKTLRIDIQINKEKGTIDDSRIYVDPLKFTQWFEDNMVNKLSMALDNLIINTNTSSKFDWSNKNASIGGFSEVIDCLLGCYKEFCENRIFGIASYLGRRIRHGTFKGTAITELIALPNKDEYYHLFEDKDFKLKFQSWMNQYELMIEDLVKTSLQIKSKRKPNGLITFDIDSQIKINTANQLMYEILAIYSKRTGVIRLPSLIIDYCWRLAENDLSNTKKLLSEKKSSHGVFSYTPKINDHILKKKFSKFSQEVNSLTSKKFGLMASWFNKPNYASPSTDIYMLFNAVISEVKENVSHFNPKIDLGDRIFTINGGTYYVIYDALYILIHNAAYHGKPDGRVQFFVSKAEGRSSIIIKIITEIDVNDDFLNVQKKIETELINSDDDAHIIEGKSGIKKLKKLENEGSISDVIFIPMKEDRMICFEFHFELSKRGQYDDIDS